MYIVTVDDLFLIRRILTFRYLWHVYRYLLFEVCVSERSSLQLLNEKAIIQTLKAAVNRAHGDYGSAHFNIGVLGKRGSCSDHCFTLPLL